MRKIIFPSLLAGTILASTQVCDEKCKSTCVSNMDLSSQCMLHCGCEEFQASMINYMEEQAHAKEFCTSFCAAMPQADQDKCMTACVNRAESTLHNMKPEEKVVLIDKIIEHEQTISTSTHTLRDEKSDLIATMK
jgi:hypothetical protein